MSANSAILNHLKGSKDHSGSSSIRPHVSDFPPEGSESFRSFREGMPASRPSTLDRAGQNPARIEGRAGSHTAPSRVQYLNVQVRRLDANECQRDGGRR